MQLFNISSLLSLPRTSIHRFVLLTSSAELDPKVHVTPITTVF